MVSTASFGAANYNSSLSSQRAGSTFFGIQTYNLSYPDWTTDTIAIQPFEPVEWGLILDNSSLSSDVLTFRPTFECEVGETVDLKPFKGYVDGRFNVTVVTPGCKVTIESSAVDPTQTNKYKTGGGFPALNYVSYQSIHSCADGSERAVMCVSKANKTLHVNEISAIICRPSYSIQLSAVTINRTIAGTKGSFLVEPIKDTPQSLLSELSSTALYNAVMANLVVKPITQASKMSEDINAMFEVMGPLVGRSPDNSTLGQFLNTTFMAEKAQLVFTGIASQLVRQDFMDTVNSTRTGTISYQENKLWANKIPTVVLSAIFALLALSSILLQFLKPWNVVPRAPDTIFSNIAILNDSSNLKGSLDATGFAPTSAIEEKLRQRSFKSRFDTSGFQVDELSTNGQGLDTNQMTQIPVLTPWRPFIVTIPAIFVLTAIPLGIIVALEVIQRLSDRSQGFISVDNRSGSSYGMAFIPAMVVTIFALLEGSLSSNSAIIAAFWRLNAGNSPARRTIFYNTVGDLFPVAIWKSIKTHYWGIVFVNIAAGVATFLTVFTAELYAIKSVPTSGSTILNRIDGFNLNHEFYASAQDDGAGILTSIVLNANLSYPAWTYDNLVFPSLSLGVILSDNEGTLTARIPALRAVLNCTVSRTQNASIKVDPKLSTYNITAEFPQTCPGGDGTLKSFNMSPYNYTGPSGYVGYFHDINVVTDVPGRFGVVYNGISNVGYPDLDVGCPSLLAYFGHQKVSADKSTIDADITVLVCTQLIQQLDTDVTFSSLALEIDPTHPPIPIESTAVYVKNELADSFARQYQLQYGILGLGNNGELDPFFDTAVNGLGGTPVEELVGAKNADRLVNVTNHLYGQYMAQAISINMRNSSSSVLSTSAPVKDALVYQRTFRIVQNHTPKLILQILLGIIAACNILTWGFTGKTKDLFYHSPSSIAGTASLIAGSELWSPNFLPKGIAYKTVGEEKMFDGWLFSLGWWTEGGEKASSPSKRFGIDVGKAD